MLKNKFMLLAAMGAFFSVGINTAFASGTTSSTPPIETVQHDAKDACKASKEGDGCMYIENDTKYTGTCQKHEGKLLCTTVK